MFASPSFRAALGLGKRFRVSMPVPARTISGSSESTPAASASPKAEKPAAKSTRAPQTEAEKPETPTTAATPEAADWSTRLSAVGDKHRLPRSVQALYLRPLRRQAEYGLPVCDLQLRSYSVRNLEFFADFALRAAYYLKLPVSGPVPLPRITQRWTVIRSNFIHKKSQENFERITLRRLIQIKDGNPEAVQTWLAFLRKHAFHGVGMKANVWEHETLGVGKSMDSTLQSLEKALEPRLAQFGKSKKTESVESIADLLDQEKFTHSDSPLTEVRKG